MTFGSFTPTALAMGGPQPALNEPAPEFTLPTNVGDGTIALSDYQGQWVVLYFYPQDFTSGCTIEARRFQQDRRSGRAGGARGPGAQNGDRSGSGGNRGRTRSLTEAPPGGSSDADIRRFPDNFKRLNHNRWTQTPPMHRQTAARQNRTV